jgi:hypothetical protein
MATARTYAIGRGMLIGSFDSQDPPPHIESLHALDWLDFSLAALLMGFGPFVAVKLADRGWVPANIGLVLTCQRNRWSANSGYHWRTHQHNQIVS